MLMIHLATGPGESHKNEIASLNVPDQDSLTEVARSISNQERTFAHRAVKANLMRDVWVLLPGGFFLGAASCAGVRGLGGSLPTALSLGVTIFLTSFGIVWLRACLVHFPKQREVDAGKICGYCGHPLAPSGQVTCCPECGYSRIAGRCSNDSLSDTTEKDSKWL
jgi:hypothetical protein